MICFCCCCGASAPIRATLAQVPKTPHLATTISMLLLQDTHTTRRGGVKDPHRSSFFSYFEADLVVVSRGKDREGQPLPPPKVEKVWGMYNMQL